jgi:hypothetical protein
MLIISERSVFNYLMAFGITPTDEVAHTQAVRKLVLFGAKQHRLLAEAEKSKHKKPKAAGKKGE